MGGQLYILGICGTFMGGLALLARELGFRVAGCDANVYPPMSTQLAAAGIDLDEGFDPARLPEDATIVIGNALSRGNPCVEAVLNRGLRYRSGPQWLAEELLCDRWVLAASGTHGKTSVSSMLAFLLDEAGLQPGFLIGGVPFDFGVSARRGVGRHFVIEADEYDTAFFDKRAKFVHYGPRTLVINNLEYDHADIYPDLASIQRQFHHLLRCVPGAGKVLTPLGCTAIDDTLAMGCWSGRETLAVVDEPLTGDPVADWVAIASPEAGRWTLHAPGGEQHPVNWSLRGRHNMANGLAAVAAAADVGVDVAQACAALSRFRGVRRRLELLGEVRGVRVYDDFAHHPTAIATTLEGLRASEPARRRLAVIEPRSNTMRKGEHRAALPAATSAADSVFWYQPPELDWSLDDLVTESHVPAQVCTDLDAMVAAVVATARPGDDIVVMSNGSFGGVHQRLLDALHNS